MGHRKLRAPRAILLAVLYLAAAPGPIFPSEVVPRSAAPEREKKRQSKSPRRAKRPVGIYHPLAEGQTLSTLSLAYHVPVATLLRVNGIVDPRSIPAGTRIFIPGARKVLPLPSDETPLAWPLEGRIMTPFNAPGRRPHDGIDIDGERGQIIRAAAAGRVLQAGRDGRYGEAILLDHGENLTTFYAHASRLLVNEGNWVERGDPIAEVGSTGNARGTHLHFETRMSGQPVNPFRFLPTSTATAARR